MRASRTLPRSSESKSPRILRRSLDAAKVGHTEKLAGFRRLDHLTRNVEANLDPLVDFSAAIGHEHRISPDLDGRTVLDDKPERGKKHPGEQQLTLFPE